MSIVPPTRGFSLIELLTIVALLIIFASVLFTRSTVERDVPQLKQVSNDIVSFVRKARVSALAVREYEGVFPSYGVALTKPNTLQLYIDCTPDDSGDGTISFNTLDQDVFKPDPSSCGGDEIVEEYTLPFGMVISDIEVSYPTGLTGSGEATDAVDEVSILYLRPEPTVWITFDPGTETVIGNGTVTLTLATPRGTTRQVSINTNNLAAGE